MLNAENITLHYGSSQILHGVSVLAKLGEITCVMGSNGVGKTSLLRVLSGTHPSSSGTYELDGENVTRYRADELAKSGVAYVPQGRLIFPMLTVRENLQTGFACLDRDDHFIPDDIYALFPVLKTMLDRRGGDLSGGQQQQLAIARALITRPRLLLLDEPTEGIQPNIITQIGEVIAHLKSQQDMAIILVEQYFDFAFGLADQIYAMMRGEIVYESRKSKISKTKLRKSVGV
ncbi:MAG: urea ABC transporter ATP-binding subunit UrtE [SAR116 cluster bacterium MED-G04]|jgi:urea transport system ATP-binding protein|nr:urea ABC transporter ATP-binding subunit UrtE [SAR116 cluster bacterium]OUW36283.1 MAG: urea ABC transporter ATP-binding subunit UrtE [Gammaproteobacteria bacterium TMED183]PDH62407.1 MAG: urea ABC transporter ATP-binding subunit UrtE [SAR116 cluster bacterium MED-G04]HCD49770.1 urea ABC transporter ATP-binding subunit UrtE [Alphaproteobacteria bacterium]CAI8400659.1 MAG: High-affinity branched-chain amino acid transport ATP-binding protein LivF [SAR116 cluster bacterium MED-G04]|tara:strand:- start:2779 stop:3474 length:696 start_codon:yes stop_codon:yes gene_type:complete